MLEDRLLVPEVCPHTDAGNTHAVVDRLLVPEVCPHTDAGNTHAVQHLQRPRHSCSGKHDGCREKNVACRHSTKVWLTMPK